MTLAITAPARVTNIVQHSLSTLRLVLDQREALEQVGILIKAIVAEIRDFRTSIGVEFDFTVQPFFVGGKDIVLDVELPQHRMAEAYKRLNKCLDPDYHATGTASVELSEHRIAITYVSKLGFSDNVLALTQAAHFIDTATLSDCGTTLLVCGKAHERRWAPTIARAVAYEIRMLVTSEDIPIVEVST